MSMSSWSVSASCWLESVCEAVGSSFTLLNELWVPSHCASTRGSGPPSSYWNAAASCSHDLLYARTIFRDTWCPSGSAQLSSGSPIRRHSAAAASASLSLPVQTTPVGLSCPQLWSIDGTCAFAVDAAIAVTASTIAIPTPLTRSDVTARAARPSRSYEIKDPAPPRRPRHGRPSGTADARRLVVLDDLVDQPVLLRLLGREVT